MAQAPSARRPAPNPPIQWTGYADVSELERYKLVSNIGKGSFGVISKVQRVDDGKDFAMKQLDYSKMTDKDRKQILAEVAILDSLKHRNIVQLIQKIKDVKNERIYIVMEYCTSGDLGSLIRKAQRTGQPLHEDKIWNIFLQITLALHHCHWPESRSSKNGRNSGGNGNGGGGGVNGANGGSSGRDQQWAVFLSDEFVKLGDFGLSKDMGTASFTSTYVGTPLYMPPEILAENKYDTKSDIWSLGCLVFEMCALASPFSTAQTQAELITMVKSGRLPPLPSHISPALKSVIKAMLNLNPVKRPTTRDLLEMDEMKLHRKLFTVQNQTSLLMARKEELKRFEESLVVRSAAMEERHRALEAREMSLQARESIVTSREEETKETQKRLNFAAETLRPEDRGQVRRASVAPARAMMDERNIAADPRMSRLYPSFEDTPSKIPTSASTLALGPARAPTPLRRNATKSLGNLGGAARAQAERDAVWASMNATQTPAKQGVPGRIGRTSIGSPNISMASPSVGSPWVPRPRRSSVAPSIHAPLPQPSSSASSLESASSGESAATTVSDRMAHIPPTMIPAPTTSYIYRECATPAKWSAEDPDLPSPFLRRTPSAPAGIMPQLISANPTATGNHHALYHSSSNSHSHSHASSNANANAPAERPVLGSINPQPQHTAPPPTLQSYQTAPPLGLKKAQIPRSRSKSGGLHAHVLRSNANAAMVKDGQAGSGAGAGTVAMERRTSADGGTTRPRAALGR
ncbi:G2-specific serine/threonine protein kinase [Saitozyma podzolica]|uniref:non-specific serine/threonine protein kinase n=1 Tax=Saitozyma podzolica TaxID=1890683 RepID=A0A427YL84_9TREE|nr:G2-specific serine/threonine protein kinase [Saitozyma podzolica]